MKKTVYALAVLVLCVSALSAQNKQTEKSTSVNAVSNSSANLAVEPGTKVAGRLQNSLDVKKAKVGDQVILKTTSSVKQDGKVVIAKGSKLIGHVTEVQKRAKGNADSRIGVVFDRLQQDGSEVPINAMITSVIQATTAASVSSGDDLFASGSGSASSTSASSAGGGGLLGGTGGLLGGVTSTVSGAANTTVNAVGGAANVVGGVTNTVAANGVATTNIVSGPLRGLSISNATGASAQGGSTLSMAGKDLRLEKGATFNLALSSSTSAEKN